MNMMWKGQGHFALMLCGVLITSGSTGLLCEHIHAQTESKSEVASEASSEAVARFLMLLSDEQTLTKQYTSEQLKIQLADQAFLASLHKALLPVIDAERVQKLINGLDDDNFEIREESAYALKTMRDKIIPQLEEALKETVSLEVKSQLKQILDDKTQITALNANDTKAIVLVKLLTQLPEKSSIAALSRLQKDYPHPVVKNRAALAQADLRVKVMHRMLDDYLSAMQKSQQDTSDQSAEKIYASLIAFLNESRKLSAVDFGRIEAIAQQLKALRTLQLKYLEAGAGGVSKPEIEQLMLFYTLLIEDENAATKLQEESKADDTAMLNFKSNDQLTDQEVDRLITLLKQVGGLDDQPRWAVNLNQQQKLLTRLQGLLSQKAEGELSEEESKLVAQDLQLVKWGLKALGDAESGYDNVLARLLKMEGIEGTEFKEGMLIINEGQFVRFSLPIKPESEYELKLRIKRVVGQDAFYIGFPVGKRAYQGGVNIAGWGGTVSGVEWINGQEAQNNPSTVKADIKNDQHYVLQMKVTYPAEEMIKIVMTKDDQPYLEWEGQLKELRGHTLWKTASPASLTLGAHSSRYLISSIMYRPLKSQDQRADAEE